jgi:hypothetical protein
MKIIISTILVCFVITNTIAQQLSFPSAEGAGKYTKGGRGTVASPTRVFYVTNLKDDGLVGSLRYALATTATSRTVIFSVSGTIHLNSNLSIKANTTIAGQTAPAGGICIADYPVSISGDNIIVRYIRFRLGDKNQLKTTPVNCGVPVAPFTATCKPLNGSGGDDAFGGTGRKNIIIDHCTMSWSNDEACSIYSGDSTTIQWCMISEPLNYSYHFETGDADFEHHGYGGIWGGRASTFHHNLFAHCQGRSCRFDGSRNLDGGTTAGKENCEFSNNVIYNWGSYNVNGGEGGNYNIQNNYYKYGLSTSNKKMVINPGSASPLPWGKYYVSGNYVDGNATTTNSNWLGAVVSGGSLADTTTIKVTTPFPNLGINLQTATDAYDAVLKSVGASLPMRDTLDERIINNVKNRTGKIIDVQGNYPHATPYSLTVAAWPTLATGNISTDTDQDGMPNWWETKNGLNINLASDRNGIVSNGYTNLENYIDSIPAWNNHANFVSFTGSKLSSTLARFNFITSWVKDGFTYALFRSSDSLGVYSKINFFGSDMNSTSFTIDDGALPSTTSYYKIASYKIGVTPDTLFSNIVKINGIITPVKFVYYDAKCEITTASKEKKVTNFWTTATEINTSYFNVQRSIDGRMFETAATIAAKGFGEYKFNDILPVSYLSFANCYYRIEAVDKDGSKMYSEIRNVKLTSENEIEVYPNPAHSSFTVKHPTAKKNAYIQIIDEAGKKCYQINVKQGTITTNILQHRLVKGNYVLIVVNGDVSSQGKLVIM